MHESGEQAQNCEDMELRHEEKLRGVHIIPMAKFVRCKGPDSVRKNVNLIDKIYTKYGLHFVWLAFFDEGVKDDDVFALLA